MKINKPKIKVKQPLSICLISQDALLNVWRDAKTLLCLIPYLNVEIFLVLLEHKWIHIRFSAILSILKGVEPLSIPSPKQFAFAFNWDPLPFCTLAALNIYLLCFLFLGAPMLIIKSSIICLFHVLRNCELKLNFIQPHSNFLQWKTLEPPSDKISLPCAAFHKQRSGYHEASFLCPVLFIPHFPITFLVLPTFLSLQSLSFTWFLKTWGFWGS